jgi:hypothetical protein
MVSTCKIFRQLQAQNRARGALKDKLNCSWVITALLRPKTLV